MRERDPAAASTRIQPYNIAPVYAALGNMNAAFAWLEQEKVGAMAIAMLKYDPQPDALGADSRFADSLRRHHLDAVSEHASH